MPDTNDKFELARKIAQRKVSFIRHAITYLVVMAALAIINNVTWGGYQWWLWAALGWGIGVTSHFLSALSVPVRQPRGPGRQARTGENE